jgi:hypothetical protein
LRERAKEKLVDAEKKLATNEEEKKAHRVFLKMAQQALSKHEELSTLMILMTVANAMTLLKSHLPDLDVELLRKDFCNTPCL